MNNNNLKDDPEKAGSEVASIENEDEAAAEARDAELERLLRYCID